MGTLLDRGSAIPTAPLTLWTRRLAGGWTQALDYLARAQDRHRQRRRLQQLDERMLKDIGLSRVDAEREWHRPFWQA